LLPKGIQLATGTRLDLSQAALKQVERLIDGINQGLV